MNIDWVHFTPWSSLAGGLTIGAAAAAFMLAGFATVFVVRHLLG